MLGPGHLDHALKVKLEGPGTARRAEVRRQVHVALQCVRAVRTEEAEQATHRGGVASWGRRPPHHEVSGKEPRDLIEGIEGEPKPCHVGGRVEAGAGMIACRAPQQRLQVHLVDGIHEGEAPFRVLQVLEDHDKEDRRKLPGVAARADRVVDEVLEERGDANGGA